jgi:hypothetical protein
LVALSHLLATTFIDITPQVLFTSDLRSFADHGLSSPLPTLSKEIPEPKAAVGLATPASLPAKRKRARATLDAVSIPSERDGDLPQVMVQQDKINLDLEVVGDESLVDRVKKRRRLKVVKP